MTSSDTPRVPIAHTTPVGATAANDGETFEVRFVFREFVRVQLGTQWLRISNHFEWHTYFKFKRQAMKWVDNGSSHGDGHAGF